VDKLRGSCLCGGVRFEIPAPLASVRYCHCESCKKLSGGAATANTRVRSADVEILAGRELIRTYQPSEGSAKSFCSVCGSNLFGGGWPESENCSVRITGIDDPFDERPQAHLYVRSVAPWETLPDDGLERRDPRST